MNTDRLAHLVTVLILVPCLAGCGAPATLTASAPVAQGPATAAPTPPPTLTPPTLSDDTTITLTWWGQSTFVLKTSTGLNALLDPVGPGTGYKIPTLEGIDLVTVSHEHLDHNAVNLAAGSPLVLRGLAGNDWAKDWAKIDQTVKGVRVRTVGVYHDDSQGSKRGKIVIPMHYKTPDLAASLAGVLASVDDFIKAIGNTATVSEVGQTVTIERKLPAGRTVTVMKYR